VLSSRTRLILLLMFAAFAGLFVFGRSIRVALILFIIVFLSVNLYRVAGMDLRKQKVIFYAITLVILAIAVSSFLNTESLSTDYTANLSVSDSITLNESYVYHVHAKEYHALYRGFEDCLVVKEVPFDSPYVKLLGVEGPFAKYAVDYSGKVYVWGAGNYAEIAKMVKSRDRRNEAGVVSSCILDRGDYRVNYSFSLYPKVLSDGNHELVKLDLADTHVPYERVRIRIKDDGRVERAYFLFPGKVERLNNGWLLEGKAGKNVRIEVDLLLSRGVKGCIVNVSNVNGIESYDYNHYRFLTGNAEFVRKAGVAALLLSMLFPAVPYALSKVYGEYGSSTGSEPELKEVKFEKFKRKPWEVNLLFKGDAFTLDESGMIATLLDLERRGYIRVKDRKTVEVLKEDEELDEFEKKLVSALKIKQGIRSVFTFAGNLSKLREEKVREVLDLRGYRLVTRMFYASLVVYFLTLAIYYMWRSVGAGEKLALAGLVILAISVICVISPAQAFSRWTEEGRRENEAWRTFLERFDEDSDEDAIYTVALGKKLDNHPKFRLRYLAAAAFVASLALSRIGGGGGGGGGGAGGW